MKPPDLAVLLKTGEILSPMLKTGKLKLSGCTVSCNRDEKPGLCLSTLLAQDPKHEQTLEQRARPVPVPTRSLFKLRPYGLGGLTKQATPIPSSWMKLLSDSALLVRSDTKLN